MKRKNAIDLNLLNEEIKLKKAAFRGHQKDLAFGTKMKIAFSLTERDKTIRNAVPLKKTDKRDKNCK